MKFYWNRKGFETENKKKVKIGNFGFIFFFILFSRPALGFLSFDPHTYTHIYTSNGKSSRSLLFSAPIFLVHSNSIYECATVSEFPLTFQSSFAIENFSTKAFIVGRMSYHRKYWRISIYFNFRLSLLAKLISTCQIWSLFSVYNRKLCFFYTF